MLFILIFFTIKLDSFYILTDVINDDKIILSGPSYNGIFLYSIDKNELKKLADYNGYNISISKDKEKLLVKDNNKVILLRMDKTEKIVINEEKKVGYPIWYNEYIAYPYENMICIVDTNGVLIKKILNVNSSFITTNGKIFAFQENDKIYIIDLDNKKELICKDEGVYYGPVFSSDGKKLVFNCLGKGIYLYDFELKEFSFVSIGYNPRFSSDSKKIIFNISTDDGEKIISSDIYIFNIEDKNLQRITDTPDISEIKPVFSIDDNEIYFSVPDGRIGYFKIGGDE